eukprot:TRINITY_DN1561_c0_g1_i1.p1 TRINITY_DN1561_c0_g1~~TRINITY_DN1561_c0_g1_i1.p1  ORF type:complete len:296 (-),score=16.83 TRINITY_DN1561_c0_g1_i1:6-893(-)
MAPHEPILLVFDLDGTLADKKRRGKAPAVLRNTGYRYADFLVRDRPHLDTLLNYLRKHPQDFHVMVWSSAKKANFIDWINSKFYPEDLVAVWDREQCELYYLKPHERAAALREHHETTGRTGDVAGIHYALTRKSLNTIWSSPEFCGKYHQGNTLLIDDDRHKASLFPENAIHPSSFDADTVASAAEYNGDTELLRLCSYLERCRTAPDLLKFLGRFPYDTFSAETDTSRAPNPQPRPGLSATPLPTSQYTTPGSGKYHYRTHPYSQKDRPDSKNRYHRNTRAGHRSQYTVAQNY